MSVIASFLTSHFGKGLFYAPTLNRSMLINTLVNKSTLPVSRADMKTHLRIDFTYDDEYIDELEKAAVDLIERESGLNFWTQTWQEIFPTFPASKIELTKRPITSVSLVSYYDSDNAAQTVDSANFHTLLPTNTRGWIEAITGYNFPATYTRPDAVTITYLTGYDTYPDAFLHCLKLIVGEWYENRESATEVNLKNIPLGVNRLIEAISPLDYA